MIKSSKDLCSCALVRPLTIFLGETFFQVLCLIIAKNIACIPVNSSNFTNRNFTILDISVLRP